jgi:capsular exopolysaccharide synthesis family protein
VSRIQQILEKAERDGSVRRMRPDPALVGGAPTDGGFAGAGMPAPSPSGSPMASFANLAVEPMTAAPAAPSRPAARVISGTHLDRRLVTAWSANIGPAEQYRALRTRILHTDNGAPVNVVLVTSPGRGEGKTLTAANLALAMAQEHQRRICLLDADLRQPQLHRLFGLPDGPGLSDVLAGDASLADASVSLDEYQMTIVPAGHATAHPTELLGTTAMRRVIESLRSTFDTVVVDATATAPLADVSIVTPLVDGVLLVVRAGVTSKPAIHDALGTIEHSKLLGLVLNEAA